MFNKNPDEFFMKEALRQAHKAGKQDEVPIGAVIVYKNEIIARAGNQVEMLKDATAHAEMIAITQASSFLGNKWLSGCSLYVTIEPCSMCAGALVLSRIKEIIYGADDTKTGACGSVFNIAGSKELNHSISIRKGVLVDDCGLLLSEFFKKTSTRQKIII